MASPGGPAADRRRSPAGGWRGPAGGSASATARRGPPAARAGRPPRRLLSRCSSGSLGRLVRRRPPPGRAAGATAGGARRRPGQHGGAHAVGPHMCSRCVLPQPAGPTAPAAGGPRASSQARAARLLASGTKPPGRRPARGRTAGRVGRHRAGSGRRVGVQRAGQVAPQPEPRQHADHRGHRHRQQHAQEAEHGAAGEQREDHPHRVQLHPVAQEARVDHVALQQLPGDEHRHHLRHPRPGRELRQRQADGGDAAGDGADIGDEGQHARRDADDQPQVQPHQLQRQGVEQRQQHAAQRLAAQPGGQDAVHLGRLQPQHPGVAAGQPAIHALHHAGPVAQQVERDHRRHHQQRQHVEQREAAAHDAGERAGQEAQHGAGLAADQVAQLAVHVLLAQPLLQVDDHLAGPQPQVVHVGRHAGDQDADLRQDQRIQQQREQQAGGDQAHHQQHRRQAAPHAGPVRRAASGSRK